MIAVPAETPVTTPVVEVTTATPVVLLLQVPPETVLVSVVRAPTHTEAVPDMTEGAALTVTMAVREQPDTV
jgi:hypothetical protein